jgi:hypothetical protein
MPLSIEARARLCSRRPASGHRRVVTGGVAPAALPLDRPPFSVSMYCNGSLDLAVRARNHIADAYAPCFDSVAMIVVGVVSSSRPSSRAQPAVVRR